MTGTTGTALMIDANYFIQRECVRGFNQNGWKTIAIPIDPPEMFIERLLTAIVVHKPDLLFTVNHLGFDKQGVLTRLLEDIELPFVSWFVDTPSYILLNHTANRSEMAVTPVWERTLIPALKNFGFDNVFHLPLGGDPELFRKAKITGQQDFNVSFVGDSMAVPSVEWRRKCSPFKGKRKVIVGAARLLRMDRSRHPINCAYETAASSGIELPDWSSLELLNVASAIILEATRQYRWETVNNMHYVGLDIFGDDNWKRCGVDGIRFHPSVDYYRELPGVYNRSAISLNLTSLQMPTAVNQRVFDVPLAGGFLIADYQEDLELLFNGSNEVATFSDLEELPELVEYYLRNDHLRERISEAAAVRVSSNHTYRHRIGFILERARKDFKPLNNVTGISKTINTKEESVQ